MKVGDLVKLNENAQRVVARPTSDWDRVGIITEWTAHQEGPLASGWVQWASRPDWDIEYCEDLEVISEGR